MRILTAAATLLVLSSGPAVPAQQTQALRLELLLPGDTIPLGEPFILRALLFNKSSFEVQVAPVFFLSHDHLELEILGPNGERVPAPSGALETCSRVDRGWFTVLGLREFIGADFEIAPDLPNSINYIYGLKEGCYQVQAELHLHDFADCFDGELEEAPIQGSITSQRKEICFSAPIPARVEQFRKQLESKSMEKVLEALIYFSNVSDQVASSKMRALLSPPENWPSRFPDEFHALTALRRQDDPQNAPYFREALGGRFGALAAEALGDLKSSAPPGPL